MIVCTVLKVLDMYLNIQVLDTYIPGIYIELSLEVFTVSIKLSITH